jgi:SAM-dependent methyltransferase
MELELRNALRRNVNALRDVLERSALEQLESTYGVLRDGRILALEQVPPLQASAELRRRREEIEAAVLHERQNMRGKARDAAAVEKFVRESAFTLLNRLAALKLMERRGLVPECVSKGPESEGYRLFCEIAPTLVQAQDQGVADGGYRLFLQLLFDDVAAEIRVLFDRTLPPSHLFPEGQALKRVLNLLNHPEITETWDVDETLGWVYQYFTPKELRDKVRKESSAPRNSYELSFRNQFYTPEYVVRFLGDNTLGRLWWEMHPTTEIGERDYLVYRDGEQPRLRTLRDPRELRILDPACGSGHFLHYCFELLLIIYREAYCSDHPTGERLRADYPDPDTFERAVPGLILQHNLWGIDIDLRATQLTALSLYLRAKRANSKAEITRVNAVLAAPMPGEPELFEEFLRTLDGAQNSELLRALLRQIWGVLGELAAEAGSLFKPERTLRRAVEEMKEKVRGMRARQIGLQGFVAPAYEQDELPLDSFPTEVFWHGLEEKLIELLRRYAERAEGRAGTGGTARRLFAEDAAHGIAFLDALMQVYDVVLTNPPFGAASTPSKSYIDSTYPRTKNDLYAAFVERGLELLRYDFEAARGGYLGAITSRTGFFLSTFRRWREDILLGESRIITFADLGHGVLDTAMVETAAYVMEKKSA